MKSNQEVPKEPTTTVIKNVSTTIKEILKNQIFVPTYQRAYSWDTETENNKSSKPKHVNVFLSDLEYYIASSRNTNTPTPYYLGHFLFEGCEDKFGVIDGQQRLTTIVIFISALYNRLCEIGKLTEEEKNDNLSLLTKNFSTVDYDNEFFKDYIVYQTKKDLTEVETVSQKRIVDAFDCFSKKLLNKSKDDLKKLLEAVQDATCTTHLINNKSDAIKMFIFQNNRGKKPSNVEIIKAQFMFNIHLYGGDKKDELIREVEETFTNIYKSISKIEKKIDEDDVLVYTLKVRFNSLNEVNAIDKINNELSNDVRIDFIKEFTKSLELNFKYLTNFFEEEKECIIIHSLVTFGNFGIVMPFIFKAYSYDFKIDEIKQLCKILESIIVRHRVISTRADIGQRLEGAFQKFAPEVEAVKNLELIKGKIDYLKTGQGWSGYWCDVEFENTLQGWIYPSTAKLLLWKYENHLRPDDPIRFDVIKNHQLEHIAPQTENKDQNSGYQKYDVDFITNCLECLGNYLLLSAEDNQSILNHSFGTKRERYTHLKQQEEIQELTKDDRVWDKEKIKARDKKIVKFLFETYK